MCTVLIAEDDKGLRSTLKNFLCTEGFDVLAAENGAVAYQLAMLIKPDIILSDVHMPVMDGYELLRKIKENPDTALIPLVFLTSDIEVTKTSEGTEEIIYKPFLLNDLLELINIKMKFKGKRKVKE